ncbi:MAG: hypothetical protein WA160_12275 [Pseudobdellovibrio sp.]
MPNKNYFQIFLVVCLFFACTKSKDSATAVTATAADTSTIIEVPDSVTGLFTGTLSGAVSGTSKVSQFANATVSKNGNRVYITFSGGKPTVDPSIPSIDNLQFVNGDRNGIYNSIKTAESLAGAHFSVYKTNLNIDNIVVGGTTIIYTGVKCDVAPENPLCTCVTNPTNPMCI